MSTVHRRAHVGSRPFAGVVAGLLLTAGTPGGASAQSPRQPRDSWVTEFGASYILTDPPANETRRALMTWELGRYFAHDRLGSYGLGVYAALNDDQFRAGIRPRYRPLRRSPGLHVGPGLILFQSDTNLRIEARVGVGLEVGLDLGDALTVVIEAERTRGGGTVRAGARAGSTIGAISGTVIPLVLFGLLIRDE